MIENPSGNFTCSGWQTGVFPCYITSSDRNSLSSDICINRYLWCAFCRRYWIEPRKGPPASQHIFWYHFQKKEKTLLVCKGYFGLRDVLPNISGRIETKIWEPKVRISIQRNMGSGSFSYKYLTYVWHFDRRRESVGTCYLLVFILWYLVLIVFYPFLPCTQYRW